MVPLAFQLYKEILTNWEKPSNFDSIEITYNTKCNKKILANENISFFYLPVNDSLCYFKI